MTDKKAMAALCPSCKQYHMIASLDTFNADPLIKKDFQKAERKGYQVMEVTCEEAKTRFGNCNQLPNQLSFNF